MSDRSNPFWLPKELNTLLWRYMSLAKFASLLQTEQIFLSRVDKLEDKFEGSLTKSHYKQTAMNETSKVFRRRLREKVYVNCWHVNDNESVAMWSLYGLSEGSVAIRSTFSRLAGVLPEPSGVVPGGPFTMGLIYYLDYGTAAPIDPRHLLTTFYQKDHSYSHEREFRVSYWDNTLPGEPSNNTLLPADSIVTDGGISIPTSLESLIESVVVSPDAAPWFRKVVEGLLTKYCPLVALKPSLLDTDPLF